MKEFFSSLPKNFLRSFSGKRIWFHVVAILLTVIIVKTDFDWYWYVHTSTSALESFFYPAVVIGMFFPILVPLGLIAWGNVRKSTKIRMTGWGIGQAALLGLIISSIYKAFTGRIQPDLTNLSLNTSHGFQFGFWKHGIFWGWPSSHTAAAFALAATFCVMYRKNKVLSGLALLYAFYIGIGVLMNIHWFSEFVAGALIGTAIGLATGKYFHQYTNR